MWTVLIFHLVWYFTQKIKFSSSDFTIQIILHKCSVFYGVNCCNAFLKLLFFSNPKNCYYCYLAGHTVVILTFVSRDTAILISF